MTASSTESRVFRPDFDAYRGYLNRWDRRRGALLVGGVVALVVITFVLNFTVDHSEEWLPFLMAGLFAIAGLYLLLHFRVTRITASPEGLAVRNFLGHTRTVPIEQLSRLVLMPHYDVRFRYATITLSRAIVLSSEERLVVSLLSDTWTIRQMDALAAALGIPIERIETAMNPAALRKRYPHTVPLWVAHWFATALIISGIIVGLAGVAIAIDIAVQYS
jgi:hypothetical protein